MANEKLKIVTPRGTAFNVSTKNGDVAAKLEWNPGFGATQTQKNFNAQSFVDSEVIRLMAPYTPFQTGELIRSSIYGTVIGSGVVNQVVPYSGKQYYETSDTRSYDAQRGGHWFERMKAVHGESIRRGAAQKAGGK